MTVTERAAQIWSVLALAAHNRQVLTYDMVAKLTGIARVGLGQCLEPIQSYCLVKNLHPLTILVVSEKTGMPGVGFIAAKDIPKSQQEVFAFDWLGHGGPSPEDFDRAVKERPSNGVAQAPEEKATNLEGRRPSVAELRKMPREEVEAILEAQAALAEQEYRNDPQLTDFEAFGEEDLYGHSSSSEEG
jgi:hypothetical protein